MIITESNMDDISVISKIDYHEYSNIFTMSKEIDLYHNNHIYNINLYYDSLHNFNHNNLDQYSYSYGYSSLLYTPEDMEG